MISTRILLLGEQGSFFSAFGGKNPWNLDSKKIFEKI